MKDVYNSLSKKEYIIVNSYCKTFMYFFTSLLAMNRMCIVYTSIAIKKEKDLHFYSHCIKRNK